MFPILARFAMAALKGGGTGGAIGGLLGGGVGAGIGAAVGATTGAVSQAFRESTAANANAAAIAAGKKPDAEASTGGAFGIGISMAPFTRAIDLAAGAVQNRFLPLVQSVLPAGFDKLVGATAGLVNSFIERGRELAKWSPELMNAQVYSQVQNMQADMREAQELGPDTARLDTTTTDVMIEIREILLPIKKWIISKLADIMEWIKGNLGAIHEKAIEIQIYLKHAGELIAAIYQDNANEQIKIANKIFDEIVDAKNALKDKPPENRLNDFLDRAVENLKPQPGAPINRPLDFGRMNLKPIVKF